MTVEELADRYALVKKLKSELKNEEMALVLLKKLKQSQTIQRESTVVGGGATLTPASKAGKENSKAAFNNKNNDLAMAKELVSSPCFPEPLLIPLFTEQHAVQERRRADEQLPERQLTGGRRHRRAAAQPDERQLRRLHGHQGQGVAQTKAGA